MRIISAIIAMIAFLVHQLSGSPSQAGMDDEWPTYRHDNQRTGTQPFASNLSLVGVGGRNLQVEWAFPTTANGIGSFKASPIVINDTVYVGNTNGFFYALDAATGTLKWQYPKPGDTPLRGGDNKDSWSYGIESPAAYWDNPPNGVVIFAAQDPLLPPLCPQGDAECPAGAAYGSARLFALDAKGDPQGNPILIWKSDLIAEINGDSDSNGGDQAKNFQQRQRMHYSPPLILDNKAYVGIQSFEDPIQIGRVVAVDLATGHIVPNFQFQAVGTPSSPAGTVRGGGVWNGPSTDGANIFFTTGNTNRDGGNPPQASEPPPNHGVSMLQVNKATGNIDWSFQPVPFTSDCDTDWSAGATVMNTSCGELIASVQKDGWSYAINASGPSCPLSGHSWQFPPTTNGCSFAVNLCPSSQNQGDALHGDEDYRRPGAAWNDVFIVRTGGWNRVQDGPTAGYGLLHALNACATTDQDRVRWVADLSTFPLNFSSGGEGALGAPSVTGGYVFIATDQGAVAVLEDPQVISISDQPQIKYRCSNTDPLYNNQSNCEAAGFTWVPIPFIVNWIYMPDRGGVVAIRNEPVIAKGRLFVATYPTASAPQAGHVYMIDAPNPGPPSCVSECARGPTFCCECQGGIWSPSIKRCIFE